MASEIDLRTPMEEALRDTYAGRVTGTDASKYLFHEPEEVAFLEDYVSPELRAAGGITLLRSLTGESKMGWRLYQAERHGGVILHTLLEPASRESTQPELVRMHASFVGKDGKLAAPGLITTVGFRVAGRSADVVPMYHPSDLGIEVESPNDYPLSAIQLAWAANKYAGLPT